MSVWSECVAKQIPNYMPETVDTASVILTKHVIPLMLNQSFDTPMAMTDFIQRHVKGNRMAVASMDMAAWAIMAEKNQQSLSAYIGGSKTLIPCGLSIGIASSFDETCDQISTAIQDGYKKIKLKIKPGHDVPLLESVRRKFPTIPLMVDANNAYTLDDLDTLQAMDDFDLLMMEQPLRWDDIVDHSLCQAVLKTPICLDESIMHVNHVKNSVRCNSAKIINIKPGRVGGFTESMRIHDYCQSINMPVWCGGMLESGIGRAYNVALASLPQCSIPGDISPSSRYWHEDIIEHPWCMNADGMMTVPSSVGIGVTVNEQVLDRYTIDRWTVS